MTQNSYRRRQRTARAAFPIDVFGSGAVILGPTVTCDGFHADRPIRVQTHIHTDHMAEFTTSLRGQVIMTKATRDLLQFEHPALPERANVRALDYGEVYSTQGTSVELISSDHSLGAAQVRVTLPDGTRVGYSGDFSWPLRQIMKVDALVVDATYGNPDSKKHCKQPDAQEALVDLVRVQLRRGPVHLMGDTGPVERALIALAMGDVVQQGVPVIANRRICWYAETHRKYAGLIPPLICEETAEAVRILKRKKRNTYIRIWGLNSHLPNDGLYDGTAVKLSRYRTGKEPVEPLQDGVFAVGFSNHADFEGTLQYVHETGAKYVVTDNHRGATNDRATKLARMITGQLGIPARPSSNKESRAWGR